MMRRLGNFVEYIRKNIWTLLTVAIVSVMAVMIGRNFIHALSIGIEIGRLETELKDYQYSISQDSALLEGLTHDDELERYAREKFYMQAEDEEIFIIE